MILKNRKKARNKAIRNKTVVKEETELYDIKRRIAQEAPDRGTNPLTEDLKSETKSPELYFPAATKFEELPISSKTKEGLKSTFVTMTAIQRATLPHSLCGRDILGASKTGSGKTLAFLIPILELLWREGWNKYDGLGALVLSPTRELAMQTFQVLRNIGNKHTELSAGLLIGGFQNIREEQDRIVNMNILIATPGRLLQHMDQTPNFSCDNLKILVLDEADRILDMGFLNDVNSIIENLPQGGRQTLLFSATQSASVSQLARLSLNEPEYISVHALSAWSTPLKLQQEYITVSLSDKLDYMWSFVKRHLRSKIIVFLATLKEVRFVYEVFRSLRPGFSVLHLHSKMGQLKRHNIFNIFHQIPKAVLFATDLVSRGLDFKDVDWVIQMDCPEDVDTYIHRVGRTARYSNNGSALLMLDPSEIKMVELLEGKKIPISETSFPEKSILSIKATVQDLLSKKSDLKILAQKAVRSYLRSVNIMENKEVFNVQKLPYQEYAASLGLIGIPKITFIDAKKVDKNEKRLMEQIDRLYQGQQSEEQIPIKPKKEKKNRVQKLLVKKNTTVLSESTLKLMDQEESDSDDDFLVKKEENQSHLMDFEDDDELEPLKKKNRGPTIDTLNTELDDKQNFIESIHQQIEERDTKDRIAYHKRISQKKLIAKIKKKKFNRMKSQAATPPTIDNPIDEEEDFEGQEHYSDDDYNNSESTTNDYPAQTTRKRSQSYSSKTPQHKKSKKNY